MISRLSPLLPRALHLSRPLALATTYGVATTLARVLCLSLVTFMITRPSATTNPPTFSEIAESFATFEILSAAIAAFAFVLWVRWMFPASGEGSTELFNSKRIESRFLPGFLAGAILAGAWIFCFLFLGQYQYVGWYIQTEGSPFSIFFVLLRALSLIVWVYCEEFVFRRKLLRSTALYLSDRDELGPNGPSFLEATLAAILTTLAFVLIKNLQFDLGWTHLLNLALLSLILSYRFLANDDFVAGAAYLIGLFVVFNPILGLPLFGSEFSGLVVLKPLDHQDEWIRRLIGGTGGPLSGFGISAILAIELGRVALKFRNHLRAQEH